MEAVKGLEGWGPFASCYALSVGVGQRCKATDERKTLASGKRRSSV